MRTLQEKYNAVLEGTFSKEQFRRDAVMQLPNMVSKFNSFEDMTAILKNRGMIAEAKKEEVTAYKKPEVDPIDLIAPDLLDDGIKAELEAAGIEGTPSEEEYEKAKEKAAKNLAQDPLCYKNAQTMPEMGKKKALKEDSQNSFLRAQEKLRDELSDKEMAAAVADEPASLAAAFRKKVMSMADEFTGTPEEVQAKLLAAWEEFKTNYHADKEGEQEFDKYAGAPMDAEIREGDDVNVDDFEKNRTNTRDFASTPKEREDGTYDISGMMGEAEAAKTLADILKDKGTLDHLKGIERLRLKLIDGPFLKKNPDWKDKAVKFIRYDAREGLVLIDWNDTSGFAYPSELVIDTEATNMSEGARAQLKEAVKALIKKTLEA
jgi:hypothetical protein